MLSEYGAEAIAGLHEQPALAYTEQYQADLIQETVKVLEELRKQGQLTGEMLWNFADFMTAQGVTKSTIDLHTAAHTFSF